MVYLIIGIVVIILFYVFVSYNSFVKLNNKINEAFSTMDVYLKKRWDLIPNIIETVKGYTKHEKNTLEEIVKLRNSNTNYDDLSTDEKMKANEKISNGINKIMALGEAYPELKSSENFKDLSNKLTKIEDEIANSRKYYNGTIRDYNNKVQMFPTNIIGSLFGFKIKYMFQASEEEKNTINVKF